ncbi:MAG: helix-turn-helix domain-containing protein [Jiangellaceae bacterium]
MYEELRSPLPLVRCTWRAEDDADGVFTDAANEYWGIAFTRHPDGAHAAELIGPSLQPRVLTYTAGDRHWGVELAAHVFWRGVHKAGMLGELRAVPVEGRWFELAGLRYPIPAFDELEQLVESLLQQGVLISDPLIAQALDGGGPDLSERSLQRRFRSATGLGRKQIEQVRRARHAYALLQKGLPLARAAAEAGYADQAHMTRSMRVFAGQTPARILAGRS